MHTAIIYKFNKQMYKSVCVLKNENHKNIFAGGALVSNDDFYIMHSIFSKDKKTLCTILKDGFLWPGKDVKHPHILSAIDLDNIYGNINFSELRNVEIIGDVSLLFSPRLVFDRGIIFNKGWFMSPNDSSIRILSSDTLEEKHKKLNDIKKYLKNPTFYSNISPKSVLTHEIMVDGPIQLSDYLIGVHCLCSDKYTQKIKQIMKEKYPNAKFLICEKNSEGYSIAPSLNEIIQ